MLHLPPQEMDPEGRTIVFWREAALTKIGVERWAERQAQARFEQEMRDRRYGRKR